MMLLLDAAPLGGGIAVFAGVGFLLAFVGLAYFVFRMLRRSVKLAVRLSIFFLIAAIAVAGSIFLFYIGRGSSERPRPQPVRTR